MPDQGALGKQGSRRYQECRSPARSHPEHRRALTGLQRSDHRVPILWHVGGAMALDVPESPREMAPSTERPVDHQ